MKRQPTTINHCIDCGIQISARSVQCQPCYRAEQQKVERCACQHRDEWTCQAITYETTPINAWLTHGLCRCWCHHDKSGQPVTQEVWERRYEKLAPSTTKLDGYQGRRHYPAMRGER